MPDFMHIKAGDQVLIEGGYEPVIWTVNYVNQHHISVGNNQLYSRRTGKSKIRKGRFRIERIATEEDLLKANTRAMRSNLSALAWSTWGNNSKIPDEAIRAVYQTLQQHNINPSDRAYR